MKSWRTALVSISLVLAVAGCTNQPPTSSTSPSSDAPASPDPRPDVEERHDSYMGAFPTFEEVEFSGTGDQIVELPEGVVAAVVATNTPSGNHVSIWATDATGTPTETLINTVGPYTGSVAFGLNGQANAVALNIKTIGAWTVKLSSVNDAPDLPASGTGDGVYWNGVHSGQRYERTVAITFPADTNFILTTYPDYTLAQLKIHSIPAIEGREIEPGTTTTTQMEFTGLDDLVTIHSSGPWNIT